jgi:hypothetical protein
MWRILLIGMFFAVVGNGYGGPEVTEAPTEAPTTSAPTEAPTVKREPAPLRRLVKQQII